jgi:tRNA pseudouridine38-40 synthase
MTKRYFIELAYNGRNYHGWQIQPNAISVQETLQKAINTLCKQEVKLIGCGRTDTGVHAKEFFAHINLDLAAVKLSPMQLSYKLNRFLQQDIAIRRIFEANQEAHSRFHALSRTYEYRLRLTKSPFDREITYLSNYPNLDFEKMNLAAARLFNYHDFSSFSKTGTDVKTNNCKIMYAKWEKEGDVWIFRIQADRFLRNMVRAIVGTLLEVGREKISLDDFESIIKSKNRNNAGWSVPAEGLALVKIEYPDWIYQV